MGGSQNNNKSDISTSASVSSASAGSAPASTGYNVLPSAGSTQKLPTGFANGVINGPGATGSSASTGAAAGVVAGTRTPIATPSGIGIAIGNAEKIVTAPISSLQDKIHQAVEKYRATQS